MEAHLPSIIYTLRDTRPFLVSGFPESIETEAANNGRNSIKSFVRFLGNQIATVKSILIYKFIYLIPWSAFPFTNDHA